MTWDVFISHASEDKQAVVEPLAHALRDAGLVVWYDRFELRLGDSLRKSIDRGLSESRYGIVVLSPAFFDKHWPQQELNGLAQREVDGEKVILPVWHNVTASEVRKFSPMLADRLAANWSEGLESIVKQILAVVKPVAGPLYTSPRVPSADHSSLILISSHDGKNLFIQAERIDAGETLKLELVPANQRERVSLAGLRESMRRNAYIAYDLTAMAGRLDSISEARSGGKQIWKLELTPEEPSSPLEVAFGQYSADKIAEMRARRILLNEQLSENAVGTDWNDMTLDSFISGYNGTIEVAHSPFPALYADLRHDVPRFLTAARLVGTLWLCLSGTVEHIFELDLRMQGSAILVNFEGQRKRQCTNMEPPVIRVKGTCHLVN